MASKKLVVRGNISINGPLGDGTSDPLLARNAVNKEVSQSTALGDYLSTTLADGYVLIGNSSNTATQRLLIGDFAITNLGLATLNDGVIINSKVSATAAIAYSKLALSNSIVNADINTSAAIARTKLANGTAYRLVVNNASGVVTDAAAITAARVLISDANGVPTNSGVTSTTLGYLDVTSSTQTQINNRLAFDSGIVPQEGDLVAYTSGVWTSFPRGLSGQYLTSTLTGLQWITTPNGVPTGGTVGQYLSKIDGTDFNTEWSNLTLDKITDVTATYTQINELATGFYDATSSVQTQLDNKMSNSLAYNALFVGSVSNTPSQLSAGTNGQLLTIVSGSPQWVTPSATGTVSGPGSSTNTALARWNGIGGTALNDSSILLDGSGNLTAVASLRTINQGGIILRELTASGTNAVTIQAAGTIASDYTITLPAASPGAGTFLQYDGADYVWASSGAGIADGDYGDIAVSSGGTTWTIDNTVVSYVKIQNVTDQKFLGNFSGGAASVSEYGLGSTLTVSGGALQTIAFTGDVTSGANSFATTIATNIVSNSKLRQSTALSIIGNSTNATANVADITAASDNQVFRRLGTALAFGSIDLSQSNTVGSSILGSVNGGSGINNAGTFTWGSNNITFTTSGSTSLTLPTSGTVATTANVWTLASGGTLTGANTITGSSSNLLAFNFATLGANSGVTINSTATDAASNTQKALEVLQSGANVTTTQSTYAGYFKTTKTGTNSGNYAIYAESSGTTGSAVNIAGLFSATNGGFNYALIVPSGGGIVGIGTSSPASTLTGTVLDVQANDNSAQRIYLRNTNAGSSAYSAVNLGNDGTANLGGFLVNGSTNSTYGGANSFNMLTIINSPITLGTNNTVRMSVSGAGSFVFTLPVTTGTGSTAGAQFLGNSLTTGNLIDASSTSLTTGVVIKAATTSTVINHTIGTNSVAWFETSGANANASRFAIALSGKSTNTGTTNTNIGVYGEASGGSLNNWAGYFAGKTYQTLDAVNLKRIIVNPTGEAYSTVFASSETGPGVYVRQQISGGLTNEHGFIDGTNFGNTTYAYGSFDAQAIYNVAGTYDHYSGFQQRATLNAGVNVTAYYNALFRPTTSATATVSGMYGLLYDNTLVNASTTITQNIGVMIGTLKGTTTFSFFGEGPNDVMYNAGRLIVGGNYVSSTRTFNVNASLPTFGMLLSNVEKWIMCTVASSNQFITGTAAGDTGFRTNGQSQIWSNDDGNTAHIKLGTKGSFAITQGVMTSAWTNALLVTPGAHTGQTTATEFPNFVFGSATQTGASGTTATVRNFWVKGNTYAGTSGTRTATNAYGLYIEPWTVGINAAITNNYALGLNGDMSILDGFNIAVGTSTGTKIGTSTSQKLAFYNSTPVVQPTGNIVTALSNLGLVASGTIPGTQLVGTTTNDVANTGNVGEPFRSIVSTYTNFTTTAVDQNITSITLTAGDWDISAFFTYSSNSATITAASNAVFAISTNATSTSTGAIEGESISYVPQAALLGTSKFSDAIPSFRVSLSGSTTYYLNAQATFTLGNPQYVGSIRARRIR